MLCVCSSVASIYEQPLWKVIFLQMWFTSLSFKQLKTNRINIQIWLRDACGNLLLLSLNTTQHLSTG